MPAITETNVSRLDAGLRRSLHAQAAARSPILVVDAHFLIREALRDALATMNSNVTVLEATDGRQAMQIVSEQADIELILLELNLPDRDGFSVLGELRQRYPAIPVVVLSARRDCDSVARALALGAAGFIPKSGRRDVMLSALELVLAGGVYIPPEILERKEASCPPPKAMGVPAGAQSLMRADRGLTERQRDVLRLMMQGKSNKAICRALNLAEPTVKNHVTAILKLLNVTNRTEAVIAAGDLGWERLLAK